MAWMFPVPACAGAKAFVLTIGISKYRKGVNSARLAAATLDGYVPLNNRGFLR
ncbi:hypothetical protein [Rhizobium aegyptiacum]|uniref:hypothetical protein n=1 Tax=Rhizobium aegyptiacum TaxID=1764550 RepID=UPI000AAA5197|nr:hypothetical protein [Rhizobium aegyptiacum]